MYWLIPLAFVLAAPLLFPEAFVGWLKQLLGWVHDLQREREQQRADLEHSQWVHKQWLREIQNLRHQIASTPNNPTIHDSLAQALTTGQHYLETVHPDQFPAVYQKTEKVCQVLAKVIRERSTKKGPSLAA